MRFKKILGKKKRAFERKNTNSVNIRLFIGEENLYFVNDLNCHEIEYLIENRYKAIYQQDLYGKRHHYLIKPPLNESNQHCFLVQIIKKVLDKKFEEVKEYRTREPDIVFKVRNRFIALEIGTGKVLNKNKKRFLEKIKSLKENYGDDWFIVVTNRAFVSKYRQFGKTVTRKNFLKKVGSYVDFDIE
ncbi:MAG: hypothetical protein ABIH79_02780 [archaeon]